MVSIEKWLGPERAYSDVEVEQEAKTMQEIAMLPTEPAESAVGEWRSFNRLAVPTSLVGDRVNSSAQENIDGARFNFECEETIQRARILSEEDGDDVLLAQHISLPGGITTGVIVSGNRLVISAGWSTSRSHAGSEEPYPPRVVHRDRHAQPSQPCRCSYQRISPWCCYLGCS